tara:strand:+ start:12419 stop:12796 length:378 start_codon:yes stop_codon:yes gene_type:complete
MKFPVFIENSKIPIWLSKIAPINISAITLGPIVLSRGILSERVKRHETIHFMQYKELYFIGFLLIYLYDYLYAVLIKKKGFSREAYLAIRFEQEAYDNDHNLEYLSNRQKNAWKKYPLGGKNERT